MFLQIKMRERIKNIRSLIFLSLYLLFKANKAVQKKSE